MQGTSPLEDLRGVDVGQIREQLRLPVKERVRVMVDAANVLIGVQEHARRADEPVPAPVDGPFLANMPLMLNLVTDFGEMDLTFVPAGRAGGFDGWRLDATEEEVSDGLSVVVASLDDIIDSKRAADRPKDRMALPYLELRDELRDG